MLFLFFRPSTASPTSAHCIGRSLVSLFHEKVSTVALYDRGLELLGLVRVLKCLVSHLAVACSYSLFDDGGLSNLPWFLSSSSWSCCSPACTTQLSQAHCASPSLWDLLSSQRCENLTGNSGLLLLSSSPQHILGCHKQHLFDIICKGVDIAVNDVQGCKFPTYLGLEHFVNLGVLKLLQVKADEGSFWSISHSVGA